MLIQNYTERIIFLDDTTDNYTPGNDQGKVRVAKLITGDIDNDEKQDIIISSGSFAPDKPHLFMIEYEETLKISEEKNAVPNNIIISQNFPNPFNPKTQFRYTLNKKENILFSIYNVTGALVYTSNKGVQNPGTYDIIWEGVDNFNVPVSSGVYFYQIRSGSILKSGKMALNK